MYIEYKELIAKRNSNKVKVNEIYFTEKGIYKINIHYKLELISNNSNNTTQSNSSNVKYESSMLLGGM